MPSPRKAHMTSVPTQLDSTVRPEEPNFLSIQKSIDEVRDSNLSIQNSLDEMRQSENRRNEALQSFIQQELDKLKASIASLAASSQDQQHATNLMTMNGLPLWLQNTTNGIVDLEYIGIHNQQDTQVQGTAEIHQEASKKIGEQLSICQKTSTVSTVELGNWIHATKGDSKQLFVQSLYFQIPVVFMIMLQSILLGWEAHLQVGREIDRLEGGTNDTKTPAHFIVVEWVFSIFFALELLVRLIAWKWKFFDYSDQEFFVWNMFDSFVVLGMFLEFAEVSTSVLRAARLLRVARVLRIIRIFSKLRKMIYAMLSSLQSLLWLMILLLITLYIFALFFMRGASDYLSDLDRDNFEEHMKLGSKHGTWVVVNRFGTLFLTMRSLFASITGGDPWDWLLLPIMDGSLIYSLVVIFFVTFFIFAVMNVVTGVFVEEAMKISQIDKDLGIEDSINQEMETIRDIKQFVAGVDKDHDGTVEIDELSDMLGDEQMKRWLIGLDIDLSTDNLDDMLRILDPEKTGKLDPDKFFDILSKLKGEARSADLVLLAHDIKQEQNDLRRFIEAEARTNTKLLNALVHLQTQSKDALPGQVFESSI